MIGFLYDIRFLIVDSADVRAGGRFAVGGREEADGVADNGLHGGLIEGGEGFMPGLEIEDLPVAAAIEAAGAEHLAARVVADQKQAVRRGDHERFAVGLLVFQAEATVNAAGNGVGRLDYPQKLGVAALAPAEVAGCSQQIAERLGMVRGVQGDHAHARENRVANEIGDRVRNMVVRHVAPPDQNVGLVENFFGNAAVGVADLAVFIVEGRRADFDVVAAEKIGNGVVNAAGVNFFHFFVGLFVFEFVPDQNTDHGFVSPFRG